MNQPHSNPHNINWAERFKKKHRHKTNKSVVDVKYNGNAHDIRHLLRDRLHANKLAQFEINLRDDSESPHHRQLQNLVTGYERIKRNRVRHPKIFNNLPFIKRSMDYDNYLPPDKDSISKNYLFNNFTHSKLVQRKTILVKMGNILKETKKYEPKFYDSNTNNFRHLITGFQSTGTLNWETSLRE